MKFILLFSATFALAGGVACSGNQGGEPINELRVQRNVVVDPVDPEADLIPKRVSEDSKPLNTKAPIHDESSPKAPQVTNDPPQTPHNITRAAGTEGTAPQLNHDADQRPLAPLDDTRVTGPEATSPDVPGDAVLSAEMPSGLSLPFRIEDLDEFNGEINPIGIVRFGKDRPDVGHSGLDVPLFEGAEIFAVADGEIVQLGSAGDPWGGRRVFHLLQGTRPGEGWGFIYEHVTPKPGLQVGSTVQRGEVIATKTAPTGFTAHIQLSYLFHDYQYISDIKCWPDKLAIGDKTLLDTWWQQYNTSEHLVGSWRSTAEQGQYPFRGLLDATAYPDGPQLCYPLGTDAR